MVTSRVEDEEFNKTISIKGVNIQDYKRNYKPKIPRGINISYYQISGDNSAQSDKEAQAVINFLTSNMHLNQIDNKTREDIDKVIDDAFSKVVLQDNVRSARDYYKVNNKKNPTAKKYINDVPLTLLENTELDPYIHRATRLENSIKEDMPKMARIWGNPET